MMIMIIIMILTLSMFAGDLPVALVAVVIGRDALLIGGSFMKRVVSRPEGSPFFDTTSTATFRITPNLLSKVSLEYDP
jgi:hypothetical protein